MLYCSSLFTSTTICLKYKVFLVNNKANKWKWSQMWLRWKALDEWLDECSQGWGDIEKPRTDPGDEDDIQAQLLINAGPTSTTLAQYWARAGSRFLLSVLWGKRYSKWQTKDTRQEVQDLRPQRHNQKCSRTLRYRVILPLFNTIS